LKLALNDEADRLATAEDYLLSYDARSQEFDAALEHVLWVHKNKPDYKKRCADILMNVIKVRCEERTVLAAIGAIK
jgi:hypothetical protein